jgi:hypothetical protein
MFSSKFPLLPLSNHRFKHLKGYALILIIGQDIGSNAKIDYG